MTTQVEQRPLRDEIIFLAALLMACMNNDTVSVIYKPDHAGSEHAIVEGTARTIVESMNHYAMEFRPTRDSVLHVTATFEYFITLGQIDSLSVRPRGQPDVPFRHYEQPSEWRS